jgi:dipeptidyl aminopeptidase/acylaminoacyl peptidase
MSADGALIVYASPTTGHGDVYRCDPDGSHRLRLTDDPNYEGSPSWSPDGRRVCFMRDILGVGHIWIMDSDGTNQRQVTDSSGSDEEPSFSHDGRRIVFCRRFRKPLMSTTSASAEIFVIDTDGSHEIRLTDNDKADWEPCFTRDDQAVIYSDWNSNIFVIPLNTRATYRIGHGEGPSPGIAGDSAVFVDFCDGRRPNRSNDVVLYDKSRPTPQLLYRTDRYISDASLCMNGEALLFLQKLSEGESTICLVDLKTGKKTVVAGVGDVPRNQ